MIGDDWCIDTLVKAANGSIENGGHEAACVLGLLDNKKAHTAAAEWSKRNDGYEEAEGEVVEIAGKKTRTWSMEEVMRSSLREYLNHHYRRTIKQFEPLLKRWRPQ